MDPSIRELRRDEWERENSNPDSNSRPNSRSQSERNEITTNSKENENENENSQTNLNMTRTDSNSNTKSTETFQLRPNTPNRNIEVGSGVGENRNIGGQSPSPGPGSRSGSASGRGSQRVKEGKRQRIDNILEEARNRKIGMDTESAEGDEGVSASLGAGTLRGEIRDEGASPGRRGYADGNGNGHGNEHANGRESRAESSADEETSVLRRGADINYGGVGVGTATSVNTDTNNGNTNNNNSTKRKLGARDPNKRGGLWGTGRGRGFFRNEAESGANNDNVRGCYENGEDEHRGMESGRIEKWYKRMVEEYGSIELENKGSVARDHLALERTFLAWLRTSLAFASIGIAITQLFRLNTSTSTTLAPSDPTTHLRHLGKPLGATFVGISILMLSVGFHRYFEGQFYIIRGKFPASRGSIALVSIITGMLMITSLVVVVVGNRGGWEK